MAVRNHPQEGRAQLVRLGGLLSALLAAVGLVLLPLPAGTTAAHAADSSGSAVTRSGTKGTWDDFSSLKVTVEQTKGLRDQGLKVSWSGGAPTTMANGTQFGYDFLQIMECWGNSPDGPTREQCEMGAPPGGIAPSQTARRMVGYPATTALYDPQETTYTGGGQTLPFQPVKGAASTDTNTFFTALTSNEQDFAPTAADGTGEAVIDLLSAVDADYLGCGAVAEDGAAPEPCWLVVVPRGTHEPDGTIPDLGNGGLSTSPLSATNWAQRIVFRLDFAPIGGYCTIGQKEQMTIGSEMAEEAITSWQPTLCTEDRITFGYERETDDLGRSAVTRPTDGSPGLAFMEAPISPPPQGKPVVYAPVSMSGLVISYNVEVAASTKMVPRIRLDARLVAKMLTGSYQWDVPGTDPPRGNLPKENAEGLSRDPEFLKLNPDLGNYAGSSAIEGIAMPQGSGDFIAELWRWLRSDPDAKSFLEGKPDPWGMTINPYFLSQLKPADSAISEFPKPDPTTYRPSAAYPNLIIDSTAANPYTASLHDDATRVLTAAQPGATGVDLTAQPPKLQIGQTLPGQAFSFGVTDAATAARYRLGVAELLNPAGQWVSPTTDSMTRAVNGWKDGPVPGVLDEDPGLRTPGAYPLTTVTYATAALGQDATARKDYAAMIRYATGPGQQSGIGPGLLPPGYAPLTAHLRDQAATAASQLVTGVLPASGGTAGGSSGGGGSTAFGDSGGGSSGITGGSATGGASAAGGASPSSSASKAALTGGSNGTSGSKPAADARGTTPGAFLGAVRWVLLIVLIAGIAGSLGGPLLIRAGGIRGAGRSLIPPRFRRRTA
ncbi:hypothetical protein SAMN05216223_102565 [Actinacidiphila yanglinensis]|uniref:PBP domain-containing protein n=1 Tax=Actinacidiphila yanglinensis TaxID=310779 RepID=A0A1H5W5C7_9ACTN|nr:hypothetical protein [Actinacidiphila yanglinensis]SEF94702.1 hypothetical protein SAMN05216223_102565 [Actinacidiphila yanglinensis]